MIRPLIILGADPGSVQTAVSWVTPIRPGRVRHIGKAMVPSTAYAIGALLETVAPNLVAVECAEGGVFQPFRAKHLLAAQYAGGIVAGLAAGKGIEVVTTSAQAWRKAVMGTLRRGQTYDEVIAKLLPSVVECLQRGNVHTRDATGIAVWASMRAVVPKQAAQM